MSTSQPTFPRVFFDIRDAVNAARARTGDRTLGTQVRAGKLRAVSVTYDRSTGASCVKPLTGYVTPTAILDYLNNLGTSAE